MKCDKIIRIFQVFRKEKVYLKVSVLEKVYKKVQNAERGQFSAHCVNFITHTIVVLNLWCAYTEILRQNENSDVFLGY